MTKYVSTDSKVRGAFFAEHGPRYYDSLQAMYKIKEDLGNLRVDELALHAMNGDTAAMRELAELRRREGDTNGMLTRDELERRIIDRTWDITRLRRQYIDP